MLFVFIGEIIIHKLEFLGHPLTEVGRNVVLACRLHRICQRILSDITLRTLLFMEDIKHITILGTGGSLTELNTHTGSGTGRSGCIPVGKTHTHFGKTLHIGSLVKRMLGQRF